MRNKFLFTLPGILMICLETMNRHKQPLYCESLTTFREITNKNPPTLDKLNQLRVNMSQKSDSLQVVNDLLQINLGCDPSELDIIGKCYIYYYLFCNSNVNRRLFLIILRAALDSNSKYKLSKSSFLDPLAKYFNKRKHDKIKSQNDLSNVNILISFMNGKIDLILIINYLVELSIQIREYKTAYIQLESGFMHNVIAWQLIASGLLDKPNETLPSLIPKLAEYAKFMEYNDFCREILNKIFINHQQIKGEINNKVFIEATPLNSTLKVSLELINQSSPSNSKWLFWIFIFIAIIGLCFALYYFSILSLIFSKIIFAIS